MIFRQYLMQILLMKTLIYAVMNPNRLSGISVLPDRDIGLLRKRWQRFMPEVNVVSQAQINPCIGIPPWHNLVAPAINWN